MENYRSNYHTHTTRCHHARGEDREYVEAAIEAGYKTIGFSDHTPMPCRDGYRSGMRMSLSDADGYFRSISDLRSEYKHDIDIKIGVEAEYFPRYFDALVDFLSQYPLDYMILGQHFINDEEGCAYSGNRTDNEKLLADYIKNVTDGAKTGKFLYIAHPDLINFAGPVEVYDSYMIPFLNEMKEIGIPLEINRLGLATGRHYPSEHFWSLVEKVGNTTCIGVDAHDPKMLFEFESIEHCFDLARSHSLSVKIEFDI